MIKDKFFEETVEILYGKKISELTDKEYNEIKKEILENSRGTELLEKENYRIVIEKRLNEEESFQKIAKELNLTTESARRYWDISLRRIIFSIQGKRLRKNNLINLETTPVSDIIKAYGDTSESRLNFALHMYFRKDETFKDLKKVYEKQIESIEKDKTSFIRNLGPKSTEPFKLMMEKIKKDFPNEYDRY